MDELWNKYLEETDEDTGRENGAAEHEPQVMMNDKPKPKDSADEELGNICDDVEELHIQQGTEELTDGEEGWSTALEGKETEKVASIENIETKPLIMGEKSLHRTNEEAKTNETSALDHGSQLGGSGSPPHPQSTHSSTASVNNSNNENNDNTHIKEAPDQFAGGDSPPDTQLTHLSPASLNNSTTEQANKEINDNTPTTEAPTHHVRKKSSVEGGRAYVDYLQLDGVEVVLLSPSRLNDTSLLSEVSNLSTE